MKKTLSTVSLWALLSLALGLWLGAAIGWGAFALGLLTLVLTSGRQLQKIQLWVRDVDAAPPAAVGPWDDILAPIYRRLKQNREQIQCLPFGPYSGKSKH